MPVEEQPYEVPGNWVWVRIKSIAEVKGGKRLPAGADFVDEITNHPYIRVSDFENGTINCDGLKYISQDIQSKISRYTISKDDVYISIAGTIGKCGIIPDFLDGANLTENAAKITDIKYSTNRYIYYVLNTEILKNQIKNSMKSTSQPKLALHRIQDLKLPLPPLNEQKRIADKVERLLDKINQAKQLIDEAKATFELRRAAILDKVFRGELTKKWREENFIKNDLKTEQNYAYYDSKIPDSWKWVRAEFLFDEFPRNGYSPKSTESSFITKTLKLGAITKGYYKNDEFKYVDERIEQDSYLWLKNGDFLIQRANSIEYVGTSAIFTGADNESIYPDLIMKGKVNETVVLNQYLVHWINSMYGKQYFRQNATGTAGNMPKINKSILQNLLVPIPPIEEQRVIMKVLDCVFNSDNDALNKLENYQPEIDLLINGMLMKAFSGVLGTNHIDDESF